MSINKLRIFFGFALLFSASLCVAQEDGLKVDGGVVIDKRKNATYFSDGLQCKYREDVQGAIKNFEQALQFMPDDAASMYELSEQYVNAGRMNDAFLMIRKAVELDSGNKWYKLRLGQFYRNMEQYDSFIKLYEDLTVQYPNDLDMLTELIDALLITEQYDRALDKMDLLEKQIGNNELITEQRLKVYARLGNSKKVISELKKQIEKNPGNTRFYNMLAQVYMNLGKEKDALAMFKKVKEIDPNDPYINVALLEFYDNKGDTDKAFAELLEAIRNKSLDLNTKVSIYEYWFKKAGQSDKVDEQARQCGEAFAEMYPDDKIGFLVMGAYYMSKEMWRQAQTAYVHALSIDSTDYVSWQNLIFAEADLVESESVRKHAIQALQFYPMQPVFYWYAGVSSAMTQHNDDAIAYLEKGRRFISDNSLMASFDSYLGDLYHEAGDEQKAFDAYDRVLGIDPDNVLVLNNYAYYLSLKNEDLDKALRMSARAVELEPDNATYLDTYAWVLYMKGNFVEAEKQMKKAIKLQKTPDAVYYEHYAEILQKLGRYKEAVEYEAKAKQLSE
ncbi:MAG: tetratricopeptide repeat protein [Bacteroidales bacterium]|nr:tetratricopeptide repeat protein [Bacteroidales bacterium]